MTPSEMVEDYLAKTGLTTVPAGMVTEADPEKGFIRYVIAGDELFCPDIYGDGRYWRDRLVEIAKENGLSKITGVARTDRPEAYCRMFGVRITAYFVEREAK